MIFHLGRKRKCEYYYKMPPRTGVFFLSWRTTLSLHFWRGALYLVIEHLLTKSLNIWTTFVRKEQNLFQCFQNCTSFHFLEKAAKFEQSLLFHQKRLVLIKTNRVSIIIVHSLNFLYRDKKVAWFWKHGQAKLCWMLSIYISLQNF